MDLQIPMAAGKKKVKCCWINDNDDNSSFKVLADWLRALPSVTLQSAVHTEKSCASPLSFQPIHSTPWPKCSC
jgi:hypothetical protein